MMYPALQLKTCRVLKFEERHLTERYVSWLNDPEVVRYSEQRHFRHTFDTCRSYFQSFAGSDSVFLAIEAQDNSFGHIGNITVSVDKINGVADMSIMIGEKLLWGKGFATAAWCGVMAYLLENSGFRKVTAGTMSVNTGMLKLMERSGMAVEAIRKRHFIFEGAEVDLVMAAKFK